MGTTSHITLKRRACFPSYSAAHSRTTVELDWVPRLAGDMRVMAPLNSMENALTSEDQFLTSPSMIGIIIQ